MALAGTRLERPLESRRREESERRSWRTGLPLVGTANAVTPGQAWLMAPAKTLNQLASGDWNANNRAVVVTNVGKGGIPRHCSSLIC